MKLIRETGEAEPHLKLNRSVGVREAATKLIRIPLGKHWLPKLQIVPQKANGRDEIGLSTAALADEYGDRL
jgi:hypothetical protein